MGSGHHQSLCDPEGRHLNVLRTKVMEQQYKVLCSFSRGRIKASPDDMVPEADRDKDYRVHKVCKGVRESDCGDEGAPGAPSPHGP